MTRTLLTLAASLMGTSALAGMETRAFEFTSGGGPMAGTLYTPEGHNGSALPTVIVTGAWTSVQGQMPATYAAAMVERGFAAVTFDFRGWGASGDLPGAVRYKEDPQAKIEDIRAAIAAVQALPEVDGNALHGLGICASAGYMVQAATNHPAIVSVGLVAPWLQDQEIVEAVYGGTEGVAGLIDISRAAEAEGGIIIPAAGPEGADGVLMPIGGYYYEADRGAIPSYDNKWNQIGWESWLTYAPVQAASDFDKPLTIVHSESAAIPNGVRKFLDGFTGTATQRWLEDVTQFDFYDNPEDVHRAADAVAAHFRSNTDAKS